MRLLRKLEAPVIGIVTGATIFVFAHLAMGRELLPGPVRHREPITPPVIDMDPQSIFSNTCATCHQRDAEGLAGQFPPLAGSDWVTRDPETPVRVLLLGVTGPIEVRGNTFNNTMPSQAHMTNEQIARIATYVRSNFGNHASPVDAALVARVRSSLGARATPWAGGAELQAARGP